MTAAQPAGSRSRLPLPAARPHGWRHLTRCLPCPALPLPCTVPQVAYCTSNSKYRDGRTPKFQIPYDIMVVSVGEKPATFGTPGVEEHCFFMKEISDSVGLRQRIQQQFELATLPGNSEEDMKQALHFVVVGGGPTGARAPRRAVLMARASPRGRAARRARLSWLKLPPT